MKRILILFIVGLLSLGLTTGCSSSKEEGTSVHHGEKHQPFPANIAHTSDYIQETYMMAAEHPDVLEAVPCYCNCYESAGHMSNRSCFIKELGPNQEVLQWDSHGTA